MTRCHLRLLLAAATLAASVLGLAPAFAQDKKPNIVFILVDNVGWGNFGVYGGATPTPRIDQLANEGIRFNNYNVEVQCTPTRSAIHTGRFSVRSGTYSVPWPGEGLAGMSPWEYTIAKLFSDSGYSTDRASARPSCKSPWPAPRANAPSSRAATASSSGTAVYAGSCTRLAWA